MSTHNIHFHEKIENNSKISLNICFLELLEECHRDPKNESELATVFIFFLIWILRPFQIYFTYIELNVHQRWAKTREPGEKPPWLSHVT